MNRKLAIPLLLAGIGTAVACSSGTSSGPAPAQPAQPQQEQNAHVILDTDAGQAAWVIAQDRKPGMESTGTLPPTEFDSAQPYLTAVATGYGPAGTYEVVAVFGQPGGDAAAQAEAPVYQAYLLTKYPGVTVTVSGDVLRAVMPIGSVPAAGGPGGSPVFTGLPVHRAPSPFPYPRTTGGPGAGFLGPSGASFAGPEGTGVGW
jgi:hypothetical protein